MRFLILIIIILTMCFSVVVAEQIHGKACYRYSDNESLNSARDIALSMAKRNALEGYVVFVETSSIVQNAALKNDLITSISGGLLKNVRIISKIEDLAKREICREIRAEVEPLELKQQTVATINAYRREKANIRTGLPENAVYKVLKLSRIVADRDVHHSSYNGQDPMSYSSYDDNGFCKRGLDCVVVYAQCQKKMYVLAYLEPGVRITWYDKDGIPDTSLVGRRSCMATGDIHKYILQLPPAGYTWKITLIP